MQVTVDCVTPERMISAQIDLEAGKGEGAVVVAEDCSTYLTHAAAAIVVKATTAGGFSTTASVAVSGDVATDGWLAVATKTGANLNYTYLADFVE